MRFLIFTFLAASLSFSCKSNKVQTTDASQNAEVRNNDRGDRPARGERKARPSVEEVFKMDVNNDGKLSKIEVEQEANLLRGFDSIDTNSDGFITVEEFQNAPKPERGRRPQRNN